MPGPDWSGFARADLIRILAHIADRNPDAAQVLKDRVEGKVARLPEHPRLYRAGRVAGTRGMVVHPDYIVVYAEGAGRVPLLRVLHARQFWP
jgi:toxin ParE1/3/4